MGNMTPNERPVPPKPAFVSMPAAVKAAIQSGNCLADINLLRWAETYSPATPEDIRQAWEAELSRRSQEPSNSFETPEGK